MLLLKMVYPYASISSFNHGRYVKHRCEDGRSASYLLRRTNTSHGFKRWSEEIVGFAINNQAFANFFQGCHLIFHAMDIIKGGTPPFGIAATRKAMLSRCDGRNFRAGLISHLTSEVATS